MDYAAGDFFCVVGGVLTYGTGFEPAKGFGIAGAFINMWATSTEYLKHSEDNKAAEKLLKENRENFIVLREKTRSWIATKKYSRIRFWCFFVSLFLTPWGSPHDEKSGDSSRKGAVEVWCESPILRWCWRSSKEWSISCWWCNPTQRKNLSTRSGKERSTSCWWRGQSRLENNWKFPEIKYCYWHCPFSGGYHRPRRHHHGSCSKQRIWCGQRSEGKGQGDRGCFLYSNWNLNYWNSSNSLQ